jgi:ribose 5-phosphate isomerase B
VRIALGSDHAGIVLKDSLVDHLRSLGHDVRDLGTHSVASVDYPDYGAAVGRAVVSGECDLGVCCCGTGNGISIAANKIQGVRAAVVHDVTTAHLAREHNDANVICFGSRVVGSVVAAEALNAFLVAEFAGDRHARRLEKIQRLEEALWVSR